MLEVLHGANVNVANITVSQKKSGSEGSDTNALCILTVDEDLSTHVLNQMKAIPVIHQVSKIKLN